VKQVQQTKKQQTKDDALFDLLYKDFFRSKILIFLSLHLEIKLKVMEG